MPVFQKATLYWYIFVLSVKLTSGEWTDQIITEFRGGVLGGMGGRCLDQELLEVKKYEDFVEVFEGPDGANEFFASFSEGINKHCIENVIPFTGNIDYEVVVFVYTSNMGAPHSLSLSVNDIDTSEILRTEVEIVDKHWTMSIIKLKRTSRYKIRLEYTKGNDDEDTFFAIDKFVLRFPTPPEWTTTEPPPIHPTDSTLPTEAPPTGSTDSTAPSEAPPTDPTDSTAPSEATPTDPTDSTASSEAPPTGPTDSTPFTECPPIDSTDSTPPTKSSPTNPTDSTSPTVAPSTDSTGNTPLTETPPTDPTDSTSPTEVSTIDPTDSTPRTESSPTNPTDSTSPTVAPSTDLTDNTPSSEYPPIDPTDSTLPTESSPTNPTVSTPPTEAPSTDSTGNTPLTETPPTDPTDSTSPTEVSPIDPTDSTPRTESSPTYTTDRTPPTDAPSTDSTDGSTISKPTPPETNNPIIIYPESDTWKIISIVTLTVCSCFIVFTVFLAYFYISMRQNILASDKKWIEPVDRIPKVFNRKAV